MSERLRQDWWLACENCAERWTARYTESAMEWVEMHLADQPTHVVTLQGTVQLEADDD